MAISEYVVCPNILYEENGQVALQECHTDQIITDDNLYDAHISIEQVQEPIFEQSSFKDSSLFQSGDSVMIDDPSCSNIAERQNLNRH